MMKIPPVPGNLWRIVAMAAWLVMFWKGDPFFEQMVVLLLINLQAELVDLNAQARKSPWG